MFLRDKLDRQWRLPFCFTPMIDTREDNPQTWSFCLESPDTLSNTGLARISNQGFMAMALLTFGPQSLGYR